LLNFFFLESHDGAGQGPDFRSTPRTFFPIIKKAVYSGIEVFLRELCEQCGVDCDQKRRMAAMAGWIAKRRAKKARFQIASTGEQKTVHHQPTNGIGIVAR